MPSPSLKFPRSHRLTSPARFAAVYENRLRETRGLIVIHALASDLPHSRLGLSVSRRVGSAPRRNRIKRLLREAFRAIQHELPAAYDLVIVVRPHEPLTVAEYRTSLTAAVENLHSARGRRSAKPQSEA